MSSRNSIVAATLLCLFSGSLSFAQFKDAEGYMAWKTGRSSVQNKSRLHEDHRKALRKLNADPADTSWSDRFVGEGIDAARVGAIAIGEDGRMYVGGDFTRAGGVRVSNIAVWDPRTQSWSPLGPGFDGPVNGLAFGGNILYAIGAFRRSGSTVVNGIASWDGAAWSALGTAKAGLNGAVLTITAVGSDTVLVGGGFSEAGGIASRNIALWDAKVRAWTGFTGTISSSTGAAFITRILADSVLYVGGSFTHAGGQRASNIATLDLRTGTWSPITAGAVNGVEGAVTVLESGPLPNQILVGGSFTLVSAPPNSNLKLLDTYAGTWSTPWPDFVELPLAATWHSRLFVATQSNTSGFESRFHYLDAGVWKPFGAAIHGLVDLLIQQNDTTVICGGSYLSIEGMGPRYLAAMSMNGDAPAGIHGFGSGVSASSTAAVYAMARDGDEVYIGGNFTSAGGIVANNIAKWNRATGVWSALGSDSVRGILGEVYALRVADDDVYLGGFFFDGEGTRAQHIARWHRPSATWNRLGSDQLQPDGAVTSLAVDGDILYAGGAFTEIDTFSVLGMAAWNLTSESWQPVDLALKNLYRAVTVDALDAQNGSLYVTGFFEPITGLGVTTLARYEGQTWRVMSTKIDGLVSALRANGDEVYLGGEFSGIGGVSANNIAYWKRSHGSFYAMGDGTDGPVRAIDAEGSRIFIGGSFQTAGGLPASNIARWDGSNWRGLGSGLDDVVYAVDASGLDVLTGGSFARAGEKSSLHFAEWDDAALGVRGEMQAPSLFTLTAGPNPFSSHIRAALDSRIMESCTLELFDALGRRVAVRQLETGSETRRTTVLQTDALPSGIYMLRASTSTGMRHFAMVKMQ